MKKFIILFLLSSIAFSATLYVNATQATTCDTGANARYATIQAAINGASAGDTIIVCRNGTGFLQQPTTVEINKPINLFGNQSGTVINATSNGGNPANEILNITRSGVNISNFTFVSAFGNTYLNGIKIISANETRIYNNNFSSLYSGITVLGGALDPNFTRNNIIYDNIFENNTLIAVGLSTGAQSNIIYNNTAYGTGNSAFGILAVSATNNTFANNTAYNNTNYGFDILSQNNTLINNTAYNNTLSGFRISATNNTLINNTAFNHPNYGFQIQTGSGSSNITGNIAHNNSLSGFYFFSSSNNNIFNNLAYNNSQYGFNFSGSSNNNISNNIANNNSLYGFYFQSASNNNNISNNTALYSGNTGFYLSSSSDNNLANNTATGNSNYGISIYTSSNNNIVSSNTIHNSSGSGIQVSQNNNNTFTSNNVYNMTVYSMFVSLSYNDTFVNNVFNNSWYGPILQSSDGNNLSGNTMAGNSIDGLQIQGSDNNIISSNTIFGNFQDGINIISGSQNNSIFLNSIYNHTNGTATGIIIQSITVANHIYNNLKIENNTYGIYVNQSNLINITGNNASNNQYGFYFDASHNNILSNNTAFNNSQTGFYFTAATGNNLTLNNATNNTLSQYSFLSSSNATFTGVNYAYGLLSSLDLNITGGSNVTTLIGSSYNNFTTDYGSIFFHNAINVSIKLMNLSDSGVAKTVCSTYGGTCTLITNNNNVVNITNNSASATINIGMFYNVTEASVLGAISGQISIAKNSSVTNAWLEVGQTTIDTTRSSVIYGPVTSFSTFGVVAFVPLPSAPISSSDTPTFPMYLLYSMICPGSQIEITAPDSDILLRLLLIEDSNGLYQGEQANTYSDVAGKAVFDLNAPGTYQVVGTRHGYAPGSVIFDFNQCTQTSTNQTVQEIPEDVPLDQQEVQQNADEDETNSVSQDDENGDSDKITHNVDKPEKEEIIAPPSSEDQEKSSVLAQVNEAENIIRLAIGEGKDVSRAQELLDAARKAFLDGDYELAVELSEKAKAAIKSKDQLNPLACMVPVVVVSAVAIYLYLKGIKRRGANNKN